MCVWWEMGAGSLRVGGDKVIGHCFRGRYGGFEEKGVLLDFVVLD